MSAVAACFMEVPSSDTERAAARLIARMPARARDGAWVVKVSGEGVYGALGHGATWTVPEDIGFSQPLRLSTGTVITFDGRLDNRAQLTSLLDMPADAPDALLVAEGFDRWGSSLPRHLLGDFAFVAFSPRTNQILAARDHMGLCPLFYRSSANGVSIASEKQALFELGEAAPRINTEMAALALVGEYIERDETFYADIRSVPPGSFLSGRAGALRISHYWRIDPHARVTPQSASDVVAQVRETLTEAVRCRSRAVGPVAVTVSGGLDSGTVAAIGAQLAKNGEQPYPVLTTARYPGAADELPYCTRIASHLGLPLYVYEALTKPGSYPLSNDVEVLYEPFMRNLAGMRDVVAHTRARIFLVGFGSDELQQVTGLDADQAVHDGAFTDAARYAGLFDEPASLLAWRRFLGAIKRYVWWRPPAPPGQSAWMPHYLTPLAADLVRTARGRLQRDLQRYSGRGPAHQIMLTWLTHSVNSPYGIARMGRMAAALGITIRQPFYDVRLVELFAALPFHLRNRPDRSKPLLRSVAEPLLPPLVVHKSLRTWYMPVWHELVRNHADQFRRLFDASDFEALGLVAPRSLTRLLRSTVEDAEPSTSITEVVNLVQFCGWLSALKVARPEPVFKLTPDLNAAGATSIVW